MQSEAATRLRRGGRIILFVAAATAIWWWLGHLEPRAGWLQVEAPRRAVAGQSLPIRVHVAPLAEPAWLCADLHWGTSRDKSKGYLATGGRRRVGTEGGTFDFSIKVPSTEGLRFVNGVIYLSTTGNWQDCTRAAISDVIAVSTNAVGQEAIVLERLHMRPGGSESEDHPRPAAIPRLLTALLFLAATVAAWSAGHSFSGVGSRPGPERRWWQAVVMVLALACLWETFGLESWLDTQARAIAQAGDFYYPRAIFQNVMVSVVLAATAVFLIFIRRARSSRRLLLACFGLYLAISAVNLLSLHVIDTVANLSWHGLTLVQALKLGCAAMTLQGVRSAHCARIQPITIHSELNRTKQG